MILHPFRLIGFAVCALALTLPIGAATGPRPAAKEQSKPVRTGETLRSSWPPETMSGKIIEVDPAQKLVILQAQDGVPFDMRVTRNTKIEAGNRKLGMDQLTSDTQKNATVRFTPERSGDVASSIQIGG